MAGEAESGMAFEYAFAQTLSEHIQNDIVETQYKNKAADAFARQNKKIQENMLRAASRAVSFLVENDKKIKMPDACIKMQPSDSTDVRDILVENSTNETIGFSLKHHHSAVKHSRLSDKIDFGKQWMGVPCSENYWQQVKPIFDDLRERRKSNELWRNLPKKHEKYYLPILQAFAEEIKKICDENVDNASSQLLKYLLGKNDFYKVIKCRKAVRIECFNFGGSLSWGRKLRIPTELKSAKIIDGKYDTIHLRFSEGWELSARIHNAESKIIPSLKFDINIVAWPRIITGTVIPI